MVTFGYVFPDSYPDALLVMCQVEWGKKLHRMRQKPKEDSVTAPVPNTGPVMFSPMKACDLPPGGQVHKETLVQKGTVANRLPVLRYPSSFSDADEDEDLFAL